MQMRFPISVTNGISGYPRTVNCGRAKKSAAVVHAIAAPEALEKTGRGTLFPGRKLRIENAVPVIQTDGA